MSTSIQSNMLRRGSLYTSGIVYFVTCVVQYLSKESDILFCSITHANLLPLSIAIWFVGDENNRNLNNLFQKLFCSPSKVPISTRKIFRNSKRSRMFNQLILTENLEISIVFFSIKSIIMKIKEWYHLSLTSNISAKNWSNCTCRGCFENLTTSRFQICPWF